MLLDIDGTLLDSNDAHAQAWVDVLAEAGAGKPIALPADLTGGVGLPPMVEIIQGPSGQVGQAAQDIRVRMTDRGGGVADVRVFINGKRADSGRALVLDTTSNLGSFERSFPIELAPGDNVIEAEAYNVIGNVRSARARVTVTLNAQQPALPSLFVVGHTLDDYGDPGLKLGFADADGDALIARLRAAAGPVFANVDVTQLKDSAATPAALEAALKELAGKARPDDVVVFFAAGHGLMVKCDTDEKPHYYLVGYGAHATKDAVCATSSSDTHLAELLRSVPAQKKVVLLDTCQSGAAATTGVLAEMLAEGDQIDDEAQRFGRSEGVGILAAAQPRESAVEIPELGHGAFTWALLRGLRGEARLGAGKQIMVQSLIAVTSQLLGDVTEKRFGQRQRTTTAYQGDNFPIAQPN